VITYSFYVCSGNPATPLEGASVILQPSHDKTLPRYQAISDIDGLAKVEIPKALLAEYYVAVLAPDHEVMAFRDFDLEETFVLPRLQPAEASLGWWHRILGVSSFVKNRGEGISIGVIDSGCCQHPDISHVEDHGSVMNMVHSPDILGIDHIGHGTAVLGLIAAAPRVAERYAGIAPGATVYSIKAFDTHLQQLSAGTQAEINEAIHYFGRKGVNLINCSFSAGEFWDTTEQEIEEAYQQGTLCICAAGNEPDKIGYPALFQRAVSVSAIGFDPVILPGSIFENFLPHPREKPLWQDNYFFATFSGRGTKITCCGPGVSVISAALARDGIPDPSLPVSGTSFAAPLVCAVLAASLSVDDEYKALPRNATRADYALNKLLNLCQPLGFPSEMQGCGIPVLK
jgi:subtilisin